MTARRILALAACAALGACTSGHATFRTVVSAPNAAPLERVLVVTRIGVGDAMRDGMSDAFRDHLAACGVRADVMHIGALDLYPERRVSEAVRQLRPSAVLTITTLSSQETAHYSSSETTQEYAVQVTSATSVTVLWEGVMTWKLLWTWVVDMRATGGRFADSILDMLRGSVLARCRAG